MHEGFAAKEISTLNVYYSKQTQQFLMHYSPICGFDYLLLLGPVITKAFKNGSGLFLHGSHNEGGTTKLN